MASVEAAVERPRYSLAYRRWLLALLVAVYACSFIDRVIVGVVGPAIKVELRLSDTQFGLLTGAAFAVFYAAFGLPIGWLAERFSRINIIAVCIALWSAMTMACGTAPNYGMLLLYRMGVGVGEGGCSPAAHSLLSDHYPQRQRGGALAIYGIGVPIGSMIGSLAGGWIAQSFDWRTAFLVVGAPGLLLALLVRLSLREPPRGFSDAAAPPAKAPPLGQVLKRLISTPTFRHVAAGCVLTNLAANGMAQFAPSYLVRAYGLGLAEVGLLYGLVVGASGTIGMLAGGFGSDLGARRDARWYVWIPAVGSILALPAYLLAMTRSAPLPTVAFMFLGGLMLSFYFAPTFAVLQNLVEQRARGTVSAVMLLLMNVFGQGLGPTVMGMVSDVLAKRAFPLGDFFKLCPGGVGAHGAAAALDHACRAASAGGLRRAILVSSVFFLWGTLHYLLAARTIRRDREAARAR